MNFDYIKESYKYKLDEYMDKQAIDAVRILCSLFNSESKLEDHKDWFKKHNSFDVLFDDH